MFLNVQLAMNLWLCFFEYLQMADFQSERERDYIQQIADLQSKLSQLLDEQKILKSRNVAVS